MITWVDIIAEVFKAEKSKEIYIKDKNFVLQVGKIAHKERKIQQPDINRKINIIINSSQGKEYFEKTQQNTYRLINPLNLPKIDNKLKKENKKYKEMLEILKQHGLSETETLGIIKIRIGQGLFREKLRSKWQGCSVTGYKEKEMLIASHIRPWSKSDDKEKLDVENGLLLTPNLDKAFDRGLITFDDDGTILISEDLAKPEKINITEGMQLSKKPNDKNKEYLKYHREHIFQDRDVAEEDEAD